MYNIYATYEIVLSIFHRTTGTLPFVLPRDKINNVPLFCKKYFCKYLITYSFSLADIGRYREMLCLKNYRTTATTKKYLV